MTMKSHPDPHATEVLNPVAAVTEKLNAVSQTTEVLHPVPRITEKVNPAAAAIPAQRQNSQPSPAPAWTHASAPAPTSLQRPRWEHLPTERHPFEDSPAMAVQQPERGSEPGPQQRLRAAQRLTQQAADRRPSTEQRPANDPQRWQRTAVVTAPAQGTLVAAGLAACDYLTRTVSILGLLAVVGMVTAGTAQPPTHERTPGTTVATAPAHQGASSSSHHQR
jgi:hypothetical protein